MSACKNNVTKKYKKKTHILNNTDNNQPQILGQGAGIEPSVPAIRKKRLKCVLTCPNYDAPDSQFLQSTQLLSLSLSRCSPLTQMSGFGLETLCRHMVPWRIQYVSMMLQV